MNNKEYEGEMDEMNNKMDELSKLSFEDWKKMATKNDPEMKEMSDKELHQTYDMIQKMVKMKRGN
jgi:ClpP class serine protease